MKTLSLGKTRGLQRLSTASGAFAILALDHDTSLRKLLNPTYPRLVTDDEVTQFKLDVLAALGAEASGILLDPVLGAPKAIETGILHSTGLLVQLEADDYSLSPHTPLETRPGWTVEKTKRLGADAVKLFFYYHPDDTRTGAQKLELLRETARACSHLDIPLLVEPIHYDFADQTDLTLRSDVDLYTASVQHVQEAGADVLKLEFPGRRSAEAHWPEICRHISAITAVPWVLLSAGVNTKTFARQLRVACDEGASGFVAGRTVWGDACQLDTPQERLAWLRGEGYRRFATLKSVAENHACSWRTRLAPEAVNADWYLSY